MVMVDKQNNSKNVESIYPLSPMQQGMLFHTLYAPKSGVYFQQLSCTLYGSVNVSAFEQAWQQVVERHPVLRTLFVWENRNKPLQVVRKWVNLPWVNHDWRSLSPIEQQNRLEALLQADREQGFELNQAPLMRCTLIKVAHDTYQFVWSHHHLLIDGWSRPIIIQEVVAFYNVLNKGDNLHLEIPRPYQDYITWLQQQDMSKAEKFWRQALNGFTVPTPLTVTAVSNNSYEEPIYHQEHRQLSATVTVALKSLAQQHELTLFTLVQGVWALLLSRYSGEPEVVFGVTVSGRPPSLTGVESMVGLFINTLPARVQVSPEADLLPWLKQLQAQQIEMEQYSYSPLIEIHGWSDVPRGIPLFASLVVFENYPLDASSQEESGTLKIGNITSFDPTNYLLTLIIVPGSELSVEISYDSCCFDPATINRILGHFQTLLEDIIANPKQCLSELRLLTEAELNQLLVEWNDTHSAYPQDKCIHQFFEAQVELSPDATAVVFEDQTLTYWELNCRANQLAYHLQTLGVAPEVLVGIFVERSLEMVVGLLGILKAGGTYVPLDPTYHKERIAFTFEDTCVPILLTQARLLDKLPTYEGQIICLDTQWDTINNAFQTNPHNGVQVDNLLYIIYTSGSTGKPKGIALPHLAMSNLLQWHLTTLIKEVGVLQFASLSFDASVHEMFAAWGSGGTLFMVPDSLRLDLEWLIHFLAEKPIQKVILPVVVLQQLAQMYGQQKHLFKNLKEVITTGEQLQITQPIINLFNQLPGCVLHNHYGPSETHVVTSFTFTNSPETWPAHPPIGQPITNTQIYLLNSNFQPVPVGIPGEVYIGGVNLARGYYGRSDLTAEKFIPNPFSQKNTDRLYKTGDQARYLLDGNIEFLTRIDNQVKIRGFRVELGEIEAVLHKYPQVNQAIVIAKGETAAEKFLVAYVVFLQKETATVGNLREFLQDRLPNYMIPAVFVKLESLPLTSNGKVDRRSLLVLSDESKHKLSEAFVAARTPAEEILTEIWVEVLGVEKVGIHDNFFYIGGHSLIATQLISTIRNAFNLDLPLRILFENPTVADLVDAMAKNAGSKDIIDEIACTLKEIKQLSPEEVKTILAEIQPH